MIDDVAVKTVAEALRDASRFYHHTDSRYFDRLARAAIAAYQPTIESQKSASWFVGLQEGMKHD